MAILVKPRSEGAHWYTAQGEPVHTRPNVDGKGEHNTTLVDARKLRLFPSVTNYLSILSKPGLEKWKVSQVLLAMSETPRLEGEAKQCYFDRVVNVAFEQVDEAQHIGTGVHGAILGALQGRPVESQYRPYVDRIFQYFDKEGITCQASEVTLVNHEIGFAGTMDFAGALKGQPLVLDWKTRKTTPGKPITSYEVQPMQVAAYGATYWKTRWQEGVLGGNIYISSTEPGRIELIPYSAERMAREWEAFQHLAAIWQWIKGYDPRIAGSAAEVEGPELAKEKYVNIVISEPMDVTPIVEETSVITKAPVQTPAIDIAETSPKREGGAKKSAPKAKPKPAKPAPKPQRTTPGKSKAKEAKFSMGVKMPIGPKKGEYIANLDDDYLRKLWKFSRKALAAHEQAFTAVKERVG